MSIPHRRQFCDRAGMATNGGHSPNVPNPLPPQYFPAAHCLPVPMFKDRRFIYALSLVLGGIGFISTYFVHSPYVLFVSFLLIGCAWAAMLALPFTILTNALSGGHMGTYLGLFNGTICIPQIVAAALGGSILALFTPEGMLPPEINMLVTAGVMLIIGAACVYLIKETKGERS